MLVEFRVGNYRSFNEEQVLSLVASNDSEHPDNLIKAEKLNLLKAAAVYGPNASGKSNLIQAIDFMRLFVRHSATRMNVGDEVEVMPFRLASDSRLKPSSFEVTLLLDGVRYDYGFTASRKAVHDEWLTAYPKGRPQRWYERHRNDQTGQTAWAFRGVLTRHGDLLKERTRDNGLVLSRGAELNVAELVPVFRWFQGGVEVIDFSVAPIGPMLRNSAQRFAENGDFERRATRFVQEADLGIAEIQVQPVQSCAKPKALGLDAREAAGQVQLFMPLDMETYYTPTTTTPPPEASAFEVRSIHSLSETNCREVFDFVDAESKGTQRLFALLGPWFEAIESAGLLVIDELDCSMHPMLTRKLLQFFQDPRENRTGAQLVFATHDTSLMDQSLFRRDQLWLVEKGANQASRLFSLYDFRDKPRKGEALEKRYLAGRYGAVPLFGPNFQDVGVD
jgi:hypothetical protein